MVLPSRAGCGETWGLVVNEAFHFGLPAIVSNGVGCQPDLVPDERFGRVFESGNAGDLALAIRQLVDELPRKRSVYAAATRTAIEQFSTARAADGILEVARRVVRLKRMHSQ
jgi:glycosyltransferase involved in cell wall biosynthesis